MKEKPRYSISYTNNTCFGYVSRENPSVPSTRLCWMETQRLRLLLHLQSPGLGVHEDQLKF